MLRLALKSVKHNPKKLILTAIAVALGVALVSATHVLTNALDSGVSAEAADFYGDVDIVVTASDDADSNTVPDEALETLRDVDGVARVIGTMDAQIPATLFDTNGERVGSTMGPPDLLILWTDFEASDLVVVAEGRAPQAPGEILMTEEAAEAAGASLGDVIEMGVIDGGTIPLEVVGIAELADGVAAFGARFSAVTLEDLRLVAGDFAAYTEVFGILEDGASEDTVVTTARDALPNLTVQTGQERAESFLAEFGSILQWVDVFSLAFAFIAVFVGGYIIVNTFRILVTQRTRELGLLRALGATGRQVRSMVLLEATAIGVVAGIVGILLGWALAALIGGLFSLLGLGSALGTMIIPLDAVIWGMSTGVLITVVSALLPAIAASRISPMEALRDYASTVRKGLRVRNIVGGAMVLSGTLATTVGLYAEVTRPYIYVGIGAVLIVIGVTLLAAQVLVPVANFLRAPLVAVWGVDGRLAANNIVRESRRSANTAAALMIGVLLLSLTATFTESVKSLVREQLAGVASADYFVAGQLPLPIGGAVVTDIEAVDGIETASRVGYVDGVQLDGEHVDLTAVDADSAESLFNILTEPPVSEIGNGAFIGTDLEEQGYGPGDVLTVSLEGASLDLEVLGVYGEDGASGILVDWATAESLGSPVLLLQIGVSTSSGADLEVVREDLEAMLTENHPLLLVITPDEILGFVNIIVDFFVGVLYALMAGAVIIAVLGVTNTLLLAVTERTREIGLLRAVGMTRRSVRRIIRIEAVVIALLGAILGSILGVGLGVAIIRALEEFGFTVIAIPWGFIGVFMVLAIIAGLVAAIWPAWRASKLDILKAIATDG